MRYFTSLFFLLASVSMQGQSISGTITDEKGVTVPYATVYIKELKLGTTANDYGGYNVQVQPGTYSVVFQSLGYESLEEQLVVGKNGLHHNVTLNTKPYQIAGVRITPGSEDPAYGIMRRAIGMAPYYQNQITSYTAEVYMKGSLKIKKLSWIVRKMSSDEDMPKVGVLYLKESLSDIKFTAPNKYDQTVKSLKSNFPDENGGDPMNFVNASFYQPKIGDMILPLAPYAFNHYNFRYEGFSMEGDVVVNKIKVIPKRKSKQLVSGYIYIADNFWNLHAVDLSVESTVGTIHLQQNFSEVEKNVWMPVSYYFDIIGQFLGNEGDVKYTASVKYNQVTENTKLKPPTAFPEVKMAIEESKKEVKPAPKTRKEKREQVRTQKMQQLMEKDKLNNREMYQMAVLMKQEAKAKDTTSQKGLEIKDNRNNIKVDSAARLTDSITWQRIRPVALTPEEVVGMKLAALPDAAHKSDTTKSAKDTLPKKSSPISKAIFGKTWTKGDTVKMAFSGLVTPTQIRFNTVDGFVAGAYFRYRKHYASTTFDIKPSLAYAFNRKRLMGELNTRFDYAPLSRGSISFLAGSESADFNRENGVSVFGNTISSLFFRTNYMALYQNDFAEFGNNIDIANGLVLKTGGGFYNRTMLENHTDFSFFYTDSKEYKPNIPVTDSVYGTYLPNHKAAIMELGISYTPRYYYRMERNRKEMVRSNYPTIYANTRIALPNLANNYADFVTIEGGISQDIHSGPSNWISYSLSYGDFVRKNRLYFPDFKHFNTQLIPLVFDDFSNSYQLLNYYDHSTSNAWATGFVHYQSPFLLLKYLPFLSNRMWQENLYASYLYTKGRTPYWEAGYGLTQISLFGGVGVFVGFNGQKFASFGIKASFKLVNQIRL